jgi:hypothetical protein
MVFFVLLAGAATKSKSSGIGMWFWGYTAWLMYKRRIADLVSFYKVALWFDVVAAGIAIAILTFSDGDVIRTVGYTAAQAFLLFSIVIILTYGLYRYFKSQNDLIYDSSSNATGSSIEDKHWEQVSEELGNGYRIDSLWIRAFSDSDGDENKAKARYYKLRYEQIKKESVSSLSNTVVSSKDSDVPLMADFLNGFKDGLKENNSKDSSKKSGESNDFIVYLVIGGCVLIFNNFTKIENFILDFFR